MLSLPVNGSGPLVRLPRLRLIRHPIKSLGKENSHGQKEAVSRKKTKSEQGRFDGPIPDRSAMEGCLRTIPDYLEGKTASASKTARPDSEEANWRLSRIVER